MKKEGEESRKGGMLYTRKSTPTGEEEAGMP